MRYMYLVLLATVESCDEGERTCEAPLDMCLALETGVVGVVSSSIRFPWAQKRVELDES